LVARGTGNTDGRLPEEIALDVLGSLDGPLSG
jgi:hypothetical protein